jgi:hypothetical protein
MLRGYKDFTAALRKAGFSSVEIMKKWGTTFTVRARR